MITNSKINFAGAATLTMMLSISAPCQTRFQIAAQMVGGLYAFNSKNGSLILEGHKLRSQYGLDMSVDYYPNQKLSWIADLEYLRSNAHTLEFTSTLSEGPSPATTYTGQVSLDEFSADVGPRYPFAGWLKLGLGPSLPWYGGLRRYHMNVLDRLELLLSWYRTVLRHKSTVRQDRQRRVLLVLLAQASLSPLIVLRFARTRPEKLQPIISYYFPGGRYRLRLLALGKRWNSFPNHSSDLPAGRVAESHTSQSLS